LRCALRPRPAVPAKRAGDARTSHTACQVADLQAKEARERQTALENVRILISSEYGPPLARSAARLAPLPCMHAWPQSRRRLLWPEPPALSQQRGVHARVATRPASDVEGTVGEDRRQNGAGAIR
jgi:hypothetical protein